MKVTAKTEDGKIECYYNNKEDRDTFTITLPSGKYGFITIRVNRFDLEDLTETLQKFDEMMRTTGQIRRLE